MRQEAGSDVRPLVRMRQEAGSDVRPLVCMHREAGSDVRPLVCMRREAGSDVRPLKCMWGFDSCLEIKHFLYFIPYLYCKTELFFFFELKVQMMHF